MNCDINGVSWPTADRLLDAGVEGFVMSANVFVGGSYPKPRPLQFDWADETNDPMFSGEDLALEQGRIEELYAAVSYLRHSG